MRGAVGARIACRKLDRGVYDADGPLRQHVGTRAFQCEDRGGIPQASEISKTDSGRVINNPAALLPFAQNSDSALRLFAQVTYALKLWKIDWAANACFVYITDIRVLYVYT